MSKAVQPLKSKRDIDRIKKALHGRDLLLFTIGINSTLRIGDILSLRVGDVSGDYIVIREQKTGKIKRIKLNKSVKDAVNSVVFKHASPSDWLVPSRKGDKPIRCAQDWRILTAAAERAGIDNIRFATHTMPKTAAYHAYKSGVKLPILMR